MIESKFNLYHSGKDGKYYIYNTLSRALLQFNTPSEFEKCCRVISDGQTPTQNESDILYKGGFIVKTETDELDRLRVRMNAAVYSQRNLATTIISTFKCNFRCPYCFESHRNKSINEESIQNLAKFYDRYATNIDALSVSWYGGEPLLVFDKLRILNSSIQDIVESRNLEYFSCISTNGFLLSESITECLLNEFKLTSFNVTLDGPSEFHNVTRPHISGAETYTTILSNLIRLCRQTNQLNREIEIKVRVNVSQENLDHIIRLFDEFPLEVRKHIRFIFMSVQSLSNVDMKFSGGLLGDPVKFHRIKEDWTRQAIEKGYISMRQKPGYSLRYGMYCGAERLGHFVIGPDSTLYKCATNLEEDDKVGCISSGGYVEYNLKNLNQWINCVKPGCRDCKLYPICFGGCKGQTYIGRVICSVREEIIFSEIERFANTGTATPDAAFLFEDFEYATTP